MRVNIITNLDNGVGLEQDAKLLRLELESRGHEVFGIQWNERNNLRRADLNIFLELFGEWQFDLAPVNWFIPNPEWCFSGWSLDRFSRILAKTRDCERIFRGLVGNRCSFLGWRARDLLDPAIWRERKFLHVAGKSRFKNTEAAIVGCRMAGVPVTVVSEWCTDSIGRVSDAELRRLMNSHVFHLCPSMYEGFGQALHEGLGCGAVVLTTDAAPMNEMPAAMLIPSGTCQPHHLGLLHSVAAEDVCAAVQKAVSMSDDEIKEAGLRARRGYEQEVCEFRANLDAVLREVA